MALDDLTQEGGDRYGPRRDLLPVIAAALAEAPDDEIRQAFGMASWRAVTAENRARYGEFFAARALDAVVDGMKRALFRDGRLSVKGFGVFDRYQGQGELFPVGNYGPLRESDMHKVEVSISAGDGDGYAVSGALFRGATRYIVGGKLHATYAEWSHSSGGMFMVPGGITWVQNLGGLGEKKTAVAKGLLVSGHFSDVYVPSSADTGMAYVRRDLIVDDPAPQVVGARWGTTPQIPVAPYESVIMDNGYLEGDAVSSWWIAEYLGKTAESFLSPRKLHAVQGDGLPLTASAWVNCFPRTRWVCGELHNDVVEWDFVKWVTRAWWESRYGGQLADLEASGYVVPVPKIGDWQMPVRVYAKFDKEFIDDLNVVE